MCWEIHPSRFYERWISMAQFTAGTEHAEPTVSSATPLPLSLGAFALTTVILGSIFSGFIVPSGGAGMSILAAVAFFDGIRRDPGSFTGYPQCPWFRRASCARIILPRLDDLHRDPLP